MKNAFSSFVARHSGKIGITLLAIIGIALAGAFDSPPLKFTQPYELTFYNNARLESYSKTSANVYLKKANLFSDSSISAPKFLSTAADTDAFTTTAAADTVSIAGVTAANFFVIQRYTPAWAATPDTGASQYTMHCENGILIVSRTKLTAASTLGSGSKYVYSQVK